MLSRFCAFLEGRVVVFRRYIVSSALSPFHVYVLSEFLAIYRVCVHLREYTEPQLQGFKQCVPCNCGSVYYDAHQQTDSKGPRKHIWKGDKAALKCTGEKSPPLGDLGGIPIIPCSELAVLRLLRNPPGSRAGGAKRVGMVS